MNYALLRDDHMPEEWLEVPPKEDNTQLLREQKQRWATMQTQSINVLSSLVESGQVPTRQTTLDEWFSTEQLESDARLLARVNELMEVDVTHLIMHDRVITK